MNKTQFLIFVFLIVLAFIWNILMCTMSPFREVLFCPDSNCFYMDGKCMALGMTPYVDFVDTKGVILFFIYMIGYLISPDKTLGVYILASVATGVTFIFLFKIVKLFNLRTNQAFVAVAICALFLFYYVVYGYGARTEQFLLPFIVWIMYTSCLLAIRGVCFEKNLLHFACSIGISSAILFLTKYNFAIYPLATFLLSLMLFYKRKDRVKITWLLVKYTTLTFTLTCLPFVAYLLCTGALTAFFDVYFKLGISTSRSLGANFFISSIHVLKNWLDFKALHWALIGAFSLYVPFYSNYSKDTTSKEFLFLSAISLICCSCLGMFNYYALAFTPLVIFAIIPVVSKLKLGLFSSLFFVAIITLIGLNYNYRLPKKGYNKKFEMAYPNVCKDYSLIEKIISSKKRAKLLYIDGLACGFSIRTGALPACPNFIYLNNAEQELMATAYDAVKNRVADFVVTSSKCPNRELLQNSGYKMVIEFLEGEYCSSTNLLWSKDEVALPET